MTLLQMAVTEKRLGGRSILRDIRLALAPGEIVSLVGASGGGKSTLLAIAAGLDTAYQGQVLLGGVAVTGPVDAIGMVFQEPRLFPWLTAAQNIGFGGSFDDQRIAALLAEVGLAGRGDALPHQLSGGQAQRVALARALVRRPRVLLLDEPFSAVDALTRMQLQELLLAVAREHAVTVLMVTHDIDEALFLGDRIVLLGDGVTDYALPAARPRDDGSGAAVRNSILARLHAAGGLALRA
ncbi:ABC transporter ATP-binding protein [Massilia sp. PWRC2]|uniref:ABC transporter ATP-binding protein n=1 Tax=Massilia sp. PWRC2 TaxID=2804626 RepID=UPI003CFB4C3C